MDPGYAAAGGHMTPGARVSCPAGGSDVGRRIPCRPEASGGGSAPMISSPDLLAFAGPEGLGFGFGYGDGAGPRASSSGLLPDGLSVPPPPAGGGPWSDFVLVAELSEQVGPAPVMTIPQEAAAAAGSPDLERLSARIMSAAECRAPGPRLDLNEDSEVVLGDSAERAFAYARHLTLLDPAARGAARPFCMAYVSSRQDKIMDNFVRLSAAFGRAAASLKTGNRQAFSSELHRLQHERSALLRDNGEKREELEALERAIAAHEDLLRQVTSYPNGKLKLPDEPDAAAPPPAGLKPLQELCNAYFLSLTTEQLTQTEVRFRGDVAGLRAASIARALKRKLKVTNFLFEPADDDDDEDEEGDGEEAAAGETGSGPGAGEEEAASGEMTGSASSGDSIRVIGTERSYRTLASPDPPLADPDPPSDAVSDPGPRRLEVYAGRANSDDSIEVLGATGSIVPEDLAAIAEEDVPAGKADNGTRPDVLAERRSSPHEAALRAQRFMRRNSFSQHVVFCLLSGRPLVLLSGDRDKLRKTADALALFLPAPAGAVVPCCSAPLQLADLIAWRLIGFHRSQSSGSLHWLSRYSRYLAVLDLDQRTLRCPFYSGWLAGSLAGRALPAAAFLPHLQSGLTALANRALLFTFARRGDEDEDRGPGDGDLSVMRFLSDLIKRRHAGSGPPALRFSYVALHVHKNNTAA